jgi:hypothetical protein
MKFIFPGSSRAVSCPPLAWVVVAWWEEQTTPYAPQTAAVWRKLRRMALYGTSLLLKWARISALYG